MKQGPSANIARQEISVRTLLFALFALSAFLLFFSPARHAQAGKSSAGKLLFFPCDKCHPLGATRPNNFEGHEIKLEKHDRLGQGNAACFVCHESIDNPARLRLADGTLISIDGDVSQVCYRCHFEKYEAWKEGLHGKQPGCTAAGCHNPHSPAWIAITPLPPFIGTTREVKVAGTGREPFEALPVPAEAPRSPNLPIVRVLALLAIVGAAGSVAGSRYLAKSDSEKRQ